MANRLRTQNLPSVCGAEIKIARRYGDTARTSWILPSAPLQDVRQVGVVGRARHENRAIRRRLGDKPPAMRRRRKTDIVCAEKREIWYNILLEAIE